MELSPLSADTRSAFLSLACVAVAYVAFCVLTMPGFLLAGSMWAEMATNYFRAAQFRDLSVVFFAPDAGYIPFPQRLIAAAGSFLEIPFELLGYFYSFTAVLLSALMVGSFCLPQFREVLPSDIARAVLAFFILVIPDFETKTFINFTYHAAFLLTVMSALAINNAGSVPRWAWALPLLAVSKPAALAALPAMILAACLRPGRFRTITLVMVALALCQAAYISRSFTHGILVPAGIVPPSLFMRAINALLLHSSFLAAYLIGPSAAYQWSIDKPYALASIGAAMSCGIGLLAWRRRRSPAAALMLVALLLVASTMLVNAVALYFWFDGSLSRLSALPTSRYIVPAISGAALIAAALITMLVDQVPLRPALRSPLVGMMILTWLAGSGWLSAAVANSRQPSSPLLHNSRWTDMAGLIRSSKGPLCVPVDPFGWVWGRDCGVLNEDMNMSWGRSRVYQPLDVGTAGTVQKFFAVPAAVRGHELQSLGLLVKPVVSSLSSVSATLTVMRDDGSTLTLVGRQTVPLEGGLLYLSAVGTGKVSDTGQAHLSIDWPVQISVVADLSPQDSMLWMGR